MNRKILTGVLIALVVLLALTALTGCQERKVDSKAVEEADLQEEPLEEGEFPETSGRIAVTEKTGTD